MIINETQVSRLPYILKRAVCSLSQESRRAQTYKKVFPLTSASPERLALLRTFIALLVLPLGPWLRSSLKPFQPSSSRSSLKLFSLSSLASRSALRARSWLAESEDCNSSMVLSKLATFSFPLLISSSSWAFALSRRSIWVWRSRTVRSTFRIERSLLLRAFSSSSICFSSYVKCQYDNSNSRSEGVCHSPLELEYVRTGYLPK